jgi:tRNA(Ile)-lysidine synthase
MPTVFLDKIKSTIEKYHMLERHDRILVAVSGGPDSVTLLHVLHAIKREYMIDILIAHLDHKFRGKESEADRKFCEGLAKKYNLQIVSEEIDVPKIAKEKGISPEEAARFERYDFFKRTAKDRGIKKIAVGHTRDDQAETVLMRIIRGAGMSGLGGIHPVKDIHGFKIIRPLIEVSRKEIEFFIKDNHLEYKIDSSNEKTIFTRNKIRIQVMPVLEKDFNPNIKEVLANMAENLQAENDFITEYAGKKLRSVSKIKGNEIIIDIRRLKRHPEAIKKRILRAGLEKLKGDLRRFGYQHWTEIDDLIDSRPVNSRVDLPAGISIVKSSKHFLHLQGPF